MPEESLEFKIRTPTELKGAKDLEESLGRLIGKAKALGNDPIPLLDKLKKVQAASAEAEASFKQLDATKARVLANIRASAASRDASAFGDRDGAAQARIARRLAEIRGETEKLDASTVKAAESASKFGFTLSDVANKVGLKFIGLNALSSLAFGGINAAVGLVIDQLAKLHEELSVTEISSADLARQIGSMVRTLSDAAKASATLARAQAEIGATEQANNRITDERIGLIDEQTRQLLEQVDAEKELARVKLEAEGGDPVAKAEKLANIEGASAQKKREIMDRARTQKRDALSEAMAETLNLIDANEAGAIEPGSLQAQVAAAEKADRDLKLTQQTRLFRTEEAAKLRGKTYSPAGLSPDGRPMGVVEMLEEKRRDAAKIAELEGSFPGLDAQTAAARSTREAALEPLRKRSIGTRADAQRFEEQDAAARAANYSRLEDRYRGLGSERNRLDREILQSAGLRPTELETEGIRRNINARSALADELRGQISALEESKNVGRDISRKITSSIASGAQVWTEMDRTISDLTRRLKVIEGNQRNLRTN